MKKTMRLVVSLAFGSLALGWVLAGTLDPPGAPAPTMVTLQQVFDKLGAPAQVIRTGQSGCWDASGTPIACSGTGQDGALVKGVTASPRFTDNANGTVTDNLTGLIWLRNANCFGGSNTWASSLTLANALASGQCGLSDGSVAGTWRLPNVKELSSLVDFGRSGPALPAGHPFVSVATFYWTSTTIVNNPSRAWGVSMTDGQVFNNYVKSNTNSLWAVRGGQ